MMQRISRSLRHEDDGFTLIELLVVVIIIGILAAVAIPVFLNQRQRGWRGAVQSDLRNHAIILETRLTDAGTYASAPAPTTSPNVAVTVPVAGTNTYCIEGSHASNAAEVWSLRPGSATGTPAGGLTQTTCIAATTTTTAAPTSTTT